METGGNAHVPPRNFERRINGSIRLSLVINTFLQKELKQFV